MAQFAKIRPRRSTTTEWNATNPILKEGELGIEVPDNGIGTGTCKFKLGDGRTAWLGLKYAFDASAAQAIYGGNVTTSCDIQLRADNAANWETYNPVLGIGEAGYDITRNLLKIGDGEHAWNDLDSIGYHWEDTDYDFGDIDEVEPTGD